MHMVWITVPYEYGAIIQLIYIYIYILMAKYTDIPQAKLFIFCMHRSN